MPSVQEFEQSIVTTRDRVDFALERITRAESRDELLGRMDEAADTIDAAAGDLDDVGAPRAYESEAGEPRRFPATARFRRPGNRRPNPAARLRGSPPRYSRVELRKLGQGEPRAGRSPPEGNPGRAPGTSLDRASEPRWSRSAVGIDQSPRIAWQRPCTAANRTRRRTAGDAQSASASACLCLRRSALRSRIRRGSGTGTAARRAFV